MRRVRWKRKDAFVQTCSKRKFGECGSQLFCSEICFLLRGTGGVRISFSLVHRADSHMKPRDANRTPSAHLSAAAPHPQEGFPKGRNRSFAPLCRFKGARGEIEIPPRFSLGGRGDILFSKENIPLASPYRNGTVPPGTPVIFSARRKENGDSILHGITMLSCAAKPHIAVYSSCLVI